MAQDGRIYITITDEPVGNGSSGGEKKSSKSKKKGEAEKRREMFINQTIHFVRQQAEQAINFSFSNIGNFTGDFNAQRQAQEIISNVGDAVNIGIAFATNVYAGIAVVAAKGIGIAYKEISGNFSNKRTNYQINQLYRISGLDGLTNGSR